MTSYAPAELSELLSRYADGVLPEDERRRLETYLAGHPEAGRELEEIRRVKSLLASIPRLKPNPMFWNALEDRLRAAAEERENLLPFPRRFLPAAVGLAVVMVAVLTVAVIQQRIPFLQVLEDTSKGMQEAYEQSILKGSLSPLFSRVGRDEALQFAMFGTLPIDEQSDATLRVDDAAEQGYRIEFGAKEPQASPVTVQQLYAEVLPTPSQERSIDSLLEEATHRLRAAAYIAENQAMAIDPDLPKMNRMLVSHIASRLEPLQRTRFRRFLEDRNAMYELAAAAVPEPVPPPPPVRVERRGGALREFIVITSETLIVTPLAVDVHRIREDIPYAPRAHRDVVVNVESLARRFADLERLQTPGYEVVVRSEQDGHPGRVEIRIEHRSDDAASDPLVRWVVPRMRVIPRPDRPPVPSGARPYRFEFGTEGVPVPLDSIVEWMMRDEIDLEQRFRSMDSLMLRMMREHGVVFSPGQFDSLRRQFERMRPPR